ncbi:hypothetical protein MXAN_4283 [Myxococcus xanthus DK 1622]|uniref:Uncharacterized protein n=1 Tax=Myxococcus xanthus (strain DK1622) TaxID=246197 RepID=Q1D4G5_MYXXD|nr:hypothetical protein MXAN_4283 [Myxococcus xanthus DK 1622]
MEGLQGNAVRHDPECLVPDGRMALVGVLHVDRGVLQQVNSRICSKVAWSRRNAKMGCVTLDG